MWVPIIPSKPLTWCPVPMNGRFGSTECSTGRVVAGQDGHERPVGIGRSLPGAAPGALPFPVAEIAEHEVGAVHLVAGSTEVVHDRTEVRTAGGAVRHEPGSLGLISGPAGSRP
jgi:hypothetical protein